MTHRLLAAGATAALISFTLATPLVAAERERPRAQPLERAPFVPEPVAELDEPWAMTFLPDGRLLVTEKRGRLLVVDRNGGKREVSGVPKVDYGGQGGLGDVILHPRFRENGVVYLSYAEAGERETRGAAVARARLALDAQGGGRLEDVQVIWQQQPKVTGRGHYAHRLAFAPDGHLFITSGDRQKLEPAQDRANTLGSVVRLTETGAVPRDNPFADQGGATAQIWSYGHRNPLGIDFDAQGRLWVHEMGPRHGDELNLIERGRNYGWPVVSDGLHYDGRPIPDHATRQDFQAPAVSWVPAISPAGFVILRGERYPGWQGSGLIGALSGQALVRVAFDGTRVREAERFDMGARVREVAEDADGIVWVLEDERGGSGGRLLRLRPR